MQGSSPRFNRNLTNIEAHRIALNSLVDLLEQMMSEMTKTGVRPIFFWRKAIYKFFFLERKPGIIS